MMMMRIARDQSIYTIYTAWDPLSGKPGKKGFLDFLEEPTTYVNQQTKFLRIHLSMHSHLFIMHLLH
jgi:hypothetical protein